MAAASPDLPIRNSSGLRSPAWQQSSTERYEAGLYNTDGTGGLKLAAIAGVALLCLFWGYAVVVAEWKALIIGVALVASVLILIDFRVGVILLILLMPISSSKIFPHQIFGVTGLNPVNMLLAATLGSYLLHALLDKSIGRFLHRPLLLLYIAPFVAAGVLGSRHVGDISLYFLITEHVQFSDTFGYFRDLIIKPLLIVIFALLVAAAVARMKEPEKLLGPFIVSVWIMGMMVVVYFVTSGAGLGQLARSSAREFLSPLGLHANELGRMYAIAYALLLFTWSQTKDHAIKLILLASIGVVVIALVLTFSRGGFVGFVFVSALFLISRRRIGSLLACATVGVAVLYFLPDAVYERVTTGFGLGANAISAGRIDRIWIPLIPDVMQSPLYGSGIGAMLWSDAVRSGRSLLVTHPHNAYLQTLLGMGIIGLSLVCAYFFHVWRGFVALSKAPDLSDGERGFYQGAAAGLIGFLMMAFADGSLTPAPEQAFLWLAIGMMYGERVRRAAS
jgi:O-antigen ligase